jgi:molybdate transport system substrate-binding protein
LFARKLLAFFALLGVAVAQEITVAAASDTSFALKEIASKFEQQNGVKVKLVFGASGNLFAQIQNGAPYDVFLSADEEYAKKLETAGLLEKAEAYASNGLALLYRKDLKPSAASLADYNLLLDPRIKKIAIANPQHAPFGRAAVTELTGRGVYEKVRGKLVLAENVAQATQYEVSGNVDVAIVSRSMGEAPMVRKAANLGVSASNAERPIQQFGGVVRTTNQLRLARGFFAYLRNEISCSVFLRHGFLVSCPSVQ